MSNHRLETPELSIFWSTRDFQGRSRGACLCPRVGKPVALTHTGARELTAGSQAAALPNQGIADPTVATAYVWAILETATKIPSRTGDWSCSQMSSISCLATCHWDPTSAPLCWCWWSNTQEIGTNQKCSDCCLWSRCICLEPQQEQQHFPKIRLCFIRADFNLLHGLEGRRGNKDTGLR